MLLLVKERGKNWSGPLKHRSQSTISCIKLIWFQNQILGVQRNLELTGGMGGIWEYWGCCQFPLQWCKTMASVILCSGQIIYQCVIFPFLFKGMLVIIAGYKILSFFHGVSVMFLRFRCSAETCMKGQIAIIVIVVIVINSNKRVKSKWKHRHISCCLKALT